MAISSDKVRIQLALKKSTWKRIKRIADERNTYGATILAEAIEAQYGVDNTGAEAQKKE